MGTFACEHKSWIMSNQSEFVASNLRSQQQTKTAKAVKVEWTPELVQMLIESVCSKKVVWDSSSASYKNKNAHESAWTQIADDCDLEGKASYTKAKWCDLKGTYRKKLKSLTPKSGDVWGCQEK